VSLTGSGLTYRPGDSLGVFGRQSPELVEQVIGLLGFNGGATVNDPRGQPTTLRQALLRDYTVNRANRKMLAALTDLLDDAVGAQILAFEVDFLLVYSRPDNYLISILGLINCSLNRTVFFADSDILDRRRL